MKKILLFLLILMGIGAVSAEYPYWIEDIGDGQYNIWTKINISAGESKTIYVQKQDGYSPDGNTVFEFFDDFEGTELDTSKWGISGTPAYTVSDGKLYLSSFSSSGQYLDISSKNAFGAPFVVEASVQYPENTDGNGGLALFRDGGFTSFIVYGSAGGTGDGFGLFGDVSYKWGQFYDFSFKKRRFVVDETTVVAYTELFSNTYSFSNSGYNKVGFRGEYLAPNLYVDHIFVRKYADQEPTVSVEQIDDTTWKITISNPNDYDLVDFQVAVEGIPLTSKTDGLYIEYLPPKEIKYIYLMNTKTVDESGILYDSIPSGYIIPQKQLVDDSGTVYNYMTENNTIYIEIPTDNPIYAQTLKTLSFNDVDYTPPTLDISIKKWIDMVFSDNSINVGGGDSSQILQHSISMDLDTKFVKSTVVLDDGTTDFAYYDFSSEYDEIQNMVDVSIDTAYENGAVIVSALLTNGKTKTDIWQLTKLDMEKIYATLQSIYSDFEGLWLKIDDLEYLFPIVSRNKQPQLNVAKDMSISGSVVYEVLGAPSNSWSFELYANDYSKIAVLEQLLQNPVCYVKIDEIGVYKQCIIDSVSYTRITTGKYSINMDLTIL